MTPEQLFEIETRAEAATPGPWESFIEGRDHRGGDSFIRTGGADIYIIFSGDYEHDELVDNQDFIAHAREDIPALIAEVRRLKAHPLADITAIERPEAFDEFEL